MHAYLGLHVFAWDLESIIVVMLRFLVKKIEKKDKGH